MSGDQHLIFVSPHLFGQFYTELVAFFRCDFIRLETLVGVIGHITGRLSVVLLDRHHIFKGVLTAAAYPSGQKDFFVFQLCLFSVVGIMQNLPQRLILGLFRIVRVINDARE